MTAVREVTGSYLRAHLSALVRLAEAGEVMVITRRGRSIARLGPLGAAAQPAGEPTTP